LIELVVVVLILSIIVGLLGVKLSRDQTDTLRDEARRLVLTMQGAQQQAILEGRPYAFAVTNDGYRFLQLDKDGKRLVPIQTDQLLAPHALPYPLTLEPVRPKDDKAGLKDGTKRKADIILFDASGEFSVFTLILAAGDTRWYVEGQSDGRISFSTTRSNPA
jgi:general secretion pathway protein H